MHMILQDPNIRFRSYWVFARTLERYIFSRMSRQRRQQCLILCNFFLCCFVLLFCLTIAIITLTVPLVWGYQKLFTSAPSSYYSLSGYPLSLPCDPNSLMPNTSQVHWKMSEDILVPDIFTDEFFIREDGHLVIQKPLLIHSGLYECATAGKILFWWPKVYNTELIVIELNELVFQLDNITKGTLFDAKGSFRQELLNSTSMINVSLQGSSFDMDQECQDGYQITDNDMFCIPCRPTFYSNKATDHKCASCVLGMAYGKIYGQSECLVAYSADSYSSTSHQNVTKIYGIEGRLETLICDLNWMSNINERDNLFKNIMGMKWTFPKRVNNFSSIPKIEAKLHKFLNGSYGLQLMMLIEGHPNKSGMYFCTVKMKSGEQITYGQEVIFAKPNTIDSDITISFPNDHCKDEEKHRESLLRLRKQMQMIWNYPHCIDFVQVFSVNEQRCIDPSTYTVDVKYEAKPNITLYIPSFQHLVCKSQSCLIQRLTPALDEIHYIYNQYVRAYFKKNTLHNNIIDPIYLPPEKICADGFETGDDNLICIPCAPGMYSDQTTEENGQKKCRHCQPGLCQDKYAQNSCYKCNNDEIEDFRQCKVTGYHYSGNCTATTIAIWPLDPDQTHKSVMFESIFIVLIYVLLQFFCFRNAIFNIFHIFIVIQCIWLRNATAESVHHFPIGSIAVPFTFIFLMTFCINVPTRWISNPAKAGA